MKKFKFQLQALMTIREWDEQNARQELGRISAKIGDLKEKLEKLEQEKTKARNFWMTQSEYTFNAGMRVAFDTSLKDFAEREQMVKKQLEEAREKRAEALSELEAASRRKKIVENLKEKRFAEYQAAYDKHEANEIEDSFYARRNNVLLS